jgi:hypothetical protein
MKKQSFNTFRLLGIAGFLALIAPLAPEPEIPVDGT